MKKIMMILFICILFIVSCHGCKPPVDDPDPPTPPPISHYNLTYTIDGEGGLILEPNLSLYEEGSMVQVTAIKTTERWNFEAFTGALTGTANSQTLVMDSNKELTAVFSFSPAPVVRYQLEVRIQGKGSVTLDPTQPAHGYIEGTSVTMTAHSNVSRWNFGVWKWYQNGQQGEAMEDTFTVVMSSDVLVDAMFFQDDPPAPIIVDVPEWIVTTSRREIAHIAGSKFSIEADGHYKLTAQLEYSESSKNPVQDKEHVYFRLGTGKVMPLNPNHESDEFVVLDRNDNTKRKIVKRNAGTFQLAEGDYFIGAYHGINVVAEDYRGAQSVHGFKFWLSWVE